MVYVWIIVRETRFLNSIRKEKKTYTGTYIVNKLVLLKEEQFDKNWKHIKLG